MDAFVNRLRFVMPLLACLLLVSAARAHAQGVTTGSMTGVVTDAQNAPVSGASVIAIHTPSGTNYEATTRTDGRFTIIGMRVGGPYVVTVTYTGSGTAFEPQTVENITVNLGVATDVKVAVRSISVQETVTVVGQSDTVFSSNRTGSSNIYVVNVDGTFTKRLTYGLGNCVAPKWSNPPTVWAAPQGR